MALTKATYSMIDGAPANVLDFGAVGDGVTDDWQAIADAISSGARGIYFPSGTYYCTKALLLYSKVKLYGDTGFQSGFSPSILQFADTTCGIVIHRYNTTCDEFGYNQTTTATLSEGADGSVIQHLYLRRGNGADTTIDGITHGIRLRARAHVDSCYISGFAGDGIHILATSGSGTLANEGNANNWGVSNTRIQNCRDGMFVDGADVNVGMAHHVDSSSNQRYGIYDSSFLGCNWIGCHCNGNTTKDILQDSANARSVFIGQYVETGGPGSEIVTPAVAIGGLWGGGLTGGYQWIGGDLSGLTLAFTGNSVAAQQAVSGTARLVETWNQGSASSTRASSYNFKSGLTSSYMPTGSMYGRPTASNITNRSAVGFEIYDGTTLAYEQAVEANGATNSFNPKTDNTWSTGTASLRWSVVYAATGSINTSDDRSKQDVEPLSDAEKRVAVALKGLVKKFRFKDSVESKGDAARIHVGVIAQDVQAAFAAEGLNGFDYALLCYDEWDAELDDDGNVIAPAGNRYGVRYEQLLAFVIAAL